MGTDADVYIILKAGEDASEELSLYHVGDEDEFEPGLKQEFEVENKDLGEITAIVVGCDRNNIIFYFPSNTYTFLLSNKLADSIVHPIN